MESSVPVVMSSGGFAYRAIADWAKWPSDWVMNEVTAVATDSQDRVFVFNRGDHPVAVFDPDGELLFSWGADLFDRPHGIWISPEDEVYCIDDLGHVIHKFTPEGRHLMTIGERGRPSDTGNSSIDYRTIQRSGPPFNFPTNLAAGPNGDLYVVDGYGNARVHQFSPDGVLRKSWGEPGSGPGQFKVPHGIAIDQNGVIFVADRENSRLQRFSPTGEYLDEWTDIARPCEVAIDDQGRVYVAELGYLTGMWPGTSAPSPDSTGGRISVFDATGTLLARFGGGKRPCEPGDFFSPHDIWLDSKGNLYLSEVIRSCCGNKRPAAGDYHTLQKLERLEGAVR